MHWTQTHIYPGSNGRTNCELEILYCNARIILPKHDELHLLCSDLSFHILCIVETWLDFVLDNELIISSYFLVRLNSNRHGGGVLLYIRDDIVIQCHVIILATWNCHCTMVVTTTLFSVPLYSPTSSLALFSTTVYFMQKENPFSTWILYSLVILM